MYLSNSCTAFFIFRSESKLAKQFKFTPGVLYRPKTISFLSEWFVWDRTNLQYE